MNPAQDWVDLRQAALDRLKEENATLLQRLSTLETSSAPCAPAPTAGVDNATGIGTTTTTTELVPCASWAAMCEEKAQLERQKEKRLLRLRQVFAAKTAEFREALSAILGVKVCVLR